MPIVIDNFTTKEANTNPKKILPTSPIKTFAFGKLKGKKQRQVKENDIRQEKEEEFFPGGRL